MDRRVDEALGFFERELKPGATPRGAPKAGCTAGGSGGGGGSGDALASGAPRSPLDASTNPLITGHLDWADHTRFGDLAPAAQRLVLYVRALIRKPDLLVLERPFEQLPAPWRKACVDFLVRGVNRQEKTRLRGLEPWQALVYVEADVPGIEALRFHNLVLPKSERKGRLEPVVCTNTRPVHLVKRR
jgi:hypothetical protein